VDLVTGDVNNIPAEYYFDVIIGKPILFQLKVVKARVTIDDGIIFPNLRVLDIVKEINFVVSQNPD
jgi:glutaredoxin 2